MRRVYIGAGLAGLMLFVAAAGDLQGQSNFIVSSSMSTVIPYGEGPPQKYLVRLPDEASLEPTFTIPVKTMGFSIPGNSYLLRRQQLVSLDFIDEDRLLFSFHVSSGLKERSSIGDEGREQRIHATVIDIATGRARAEAEWTMPDRRRYLWMLKDGRFLLRTENGLDEGDSELRTKEYLRWPGRLMWIEMDPEQKYLIANSVEAGTLGQTAADAGSSAAQKAVEEDRPADTKNVLTIRTVKRETGEVVRTTQAAWTSQTADWPMNSEGYVETVHDKGMHWVMKLVPYVGEKERAVGETDSVCVPQYSFVTDSESLMSRCDPQEGWRLVASDSAGKTLWETKTGSNTMWPLLMTARDGSRVARETLVLKRSAEKYKTGVRIKDVRGQMVRVFDAMTGKVAMEAPVHPIYDGGGNVAISPSGKRVAIVNEDAIRVYELSDPSVGAFDHK
jgi:hypothetical protein